MISSSKQLKDKVRNISDGNSNKATTLIRNFMMERFLERVSISSYSYLYQKKQSAPYVVRNMVSLMQITMSIQKSEEQ